MTEEDDYEVLPHQVLEDLKGEVETLKNKLSQPDTKSQELILEMESLKDSIRDLQEVFHTALELSKGEDLSQTVRGLREKVEAVVQQNETIAKALLSISDKLEAAAVKKVAPAVNSMQPGQSQMGFPSVGGPRMAPRSPLGPSAGPFGASPFSSSSAPMMPDLPPPPAPPLRGRKGLF